MRLGIPRGLFYYDYMEFIRILFDSSDVELVWGDENSDEILEYGNRFVVNEACLPTKLFAGQAAALTETCNAVMIPRLMKDCRGRWMCPKLLGMPEMLWELPEQKKLLITGPLYFDDRKSLKKTLWELCRKTGMPRSGFVRNFDAAYEHQMKIASGITEAHIEAAWEFMPPEPSDDEIILPNRFKVLLSGHCYNVYDKYANRQIMKKLDDLGIGTITQNAVDQAACEAAVSAAGLIKAPFWESMIRILGAALCMKDDVDGLIYLSSFSCGPDSFITEILKEHITEIPVMVLKLDEHKGEAGFETRLEAFADLLERRRSS